MWTSRESTCVEAHAWKYMHGSIRVEVHVWKHTRGSTCVEAHTWKYMRGTKQCSVFRCSNVMMFQSVFQCSEQNNVAFFNVLYTRFVHNNSTAWEANNIVSAYLLFPSFVV